MSQGCPTIAFGDLWVGDRFKLPGKPEMTWTKLDVETARRHSEASIALRERGFGYIGDAICSFFATEPVHFQPPQV